MLVTSEPLDALARRVEANWAAVCEDPDQWAPVMLGRYHLDHELGRGAFGVVFSALDLEIERDVAVKVFHAPGPTHSAKHGRSRGCAIPTSSPCTTTGVTGP